MSRASGAELERRIDEIYDLLVSRVSYRAIYAYAEKRWGLGERQAARYVAAAKERIRAAAAEGRQAQLARALASYEAICAKQLAAGRLAEARKTIDSIVHLLGLAAPEKLELYDFSNYSDSQLAAEVAHELPELLREAERITGGASPPGRDPTDPLDPPLPDA